MNLEGFIVKNDKSVFNPTTGVEYRLSTFMVDVRLINVDNTGTFKTCRFVPSMHRTEWIYKEVDFHPYNKLGRTPWTRCTGEELETVEEFILNNM